MALTCRDARILIDGVGSIYQNCNQRNFGSIKSNTLVNEDVDEICWTRLSDAGDSTRTILEQTQIRFYLYEPNSKLFIKKDGVTKYWSVFDVAMRASAALTSNMHEAYSASSKKDAQTYLKTIVNDCGYASIGTNRGKVELDDFLGCKVDNSAMCVIINVKWLVVQEATCMYSIEDK